GGTDDLVDEEKGFGELVAGDVGPRFGQEVLRSGRGPIGQLDDGHHFGAPAFGGSAGHHHVGHGRVGDDGLLDLLGEDLLAPGVDGDRVPAEELDLAVGQVAGPVAGDRVADAVDEGEGAGRLL